MKPNAFRVVRGSPIRRLALACFLVLAGGSVVLAQSNAPAPKIEFDSTTFNFGRVKSGETIKHDFVFTNSGNATLEITEVKPGCGCTTAGAWDKKVEPGKTGLIPLQFNSTGFGGQLAKSATVSCNDPARTNVHLQISGIVWKPIEVTPQMAMFNISAETPTNQTKILKIVSNLEEPVTLSDLQSKSPAFKADLKDLKPGKEFELHVTAVPPFSNSTVFSTITLKTSSTNAPNLSVSTYLIMQQPVTVSPHQVMLPAGPLKDPVKMAVLVHNNGTNMLELSDLRLDIPGVDMNVTQPQTGRLYSITLSFPIGFELQQTQKVELAMKSSHPKFPEIKVPIIQMKPVKATPPSAGASRVTTPSPTQVRTPSPLRTASPVPAAKPIPGSQTHPAAEK